MNKLFLKKFLNSDLHIGSRPLKNDSGLEAFLVGCRYKSYIFNLTATTYFLRYSLKFLQKIFFCKKKILFLGSPKGLEKKFAQLCLKNNHYFSFDWPVEEKMHKNFPVLIFIFDLSSFSETAKNKLFSADIPIMAFIDSNESVKNVDFYIPVNIKSWKGGIFAYNLFFHLFEAYSKNL